MANIEKNAEIEVQINRKSGCRVDLEVKALPPCILKARKEAIKEINKNISIPGFRKGKAPEELIVKNYSAAVDEETKRALANIAFVEAQNLSKMYPLKDFQISYNVKSINLEKKEADLTYSFECEPEAPSIDPKAFKLEKIELPVVDEQKVEEMTRQLRFFYAEWKEVKDRPIQEGDFVIIDLESIETDPPTSVYSNVRFEVKEGKIAEWMKKLLIGAKSQDVLEGISEVDATASEEEKKNFSPKKVRLTVKIVEEAALPPLDDEFAKKIGNANIAEMQDSIRKRLSRQLDAEMDVKKRHQVNSFLYANYSFELPATLVEEERKYRSEQFFKDHDPAQMNAEEKKKAEDTIVEDAKKAIALFYLTKKAISDFKLSVSEEDLKKERSLDFYSSKKVDSIPREELGVLYSRAILRKVQDFILAQAAG